MKFQMQSSKMIYHRSVGDGRLKCVVGKWSAGRGSLPNSEIAQATSLALRVSVWILLIPFRLSCTVRIVNCQALQNSRPSLYCLWSRKWGAPIKRGETGLLESRHTTTSDTYLSIYHRSHTFYGSDNGDSEWRGRRHERGLRNLWLDGGHVFRLGLWYLCRTHQKQCRTIGQYWSVGFSVL